MENFNYQVFHIFNYQILNSLVLIKVEMDVELFFQNSHKHRNLKHKLMKKVFLYKNYVLVQNLKLNTFNYNLKIEVRVMI